MADQPTAQATSSFPRSYTNASLTAIAVLLCVLSLQGAGVRAPEAYAKPTPERVAGALNPAEQRRQMLNELRSLNAKMDQLESLTLRVEVTNAASFPIDASDPAEGE